MSKIVVSIVFLIMIASCTASEPAQVEQVQVQEATQVKQDSTSLENIPTKTDEISEESIPTETTAPTEYIEFPTPTQESTGPECYGPEPHEVGLGIAESFPDTSYEQIMTWFCDGAEFEDILVALQTEKLTDFPAGEMLLMLADDWTWDEIWQVTGLAEE